MSRDARNSILLWVGAIAFTALFWAALHFHIGLDIHYRWIWPIWAGLIATNVCLSIWRYVRQRKR
jgi:hypothetical protein